MVNVRLTTKSQIDRRRYLGRLTNLVDRQDGETRRARRSERWLLVAVLLASVLTVLTVHNTLSRFMNPAPAMIGAVLIQMMAACAIFAFGYGGERGDRTVRAIGAGMLAPVALSLLAITVARLTFGGGKEDLIARAGVCAAMLAAECFAIGLGWWHAVAKSRLADQVEHCAYFEGIYKEAHDQPGEEQVILEDALSEARSKASAWRHAPDTNHHRQVWEHRASSLWRAHPDNRNASGDHQDSFVAEHDVRSSTLHDAVVKNGKATHGDDALNKASLR